MKAIFKPRYDNFSYNRPKQYFSYTGQIVEVVRQLKGGCFKVKTEDGFEFEAPLRYLEIFEM